MLDFKSDLKEIVIDNLTIELQILQKYFLVLQYMMFFYHIYMW